MLFSRAPVMPVPRALGINHVPATQIQERYGAKHRSASMQIDDADEKVYYQSGGLVPYNIRKADRALFKEFVSLVKSEQNKLDGGLDDVSLQVCTSIGVTLSPGPRMH